MGSTSVGLIGLGAMGSGLARRLLAAGFQLTVHNRSPGKIAPLAAAGARAAVTAAAVAAAADVVVISLSDEAAVDAVVVGEICPVLRPGTLIIDTSTVSPEFSRRTQAHVVRAGGRRLEACVVGNPSQASAGELRVLAGGAAADLDQARPVLDVISTQVVHLGPTGAGATMKLAMNLLLGAQVVALAEAVSFGVAAGLDRDLMLAAIAASGFSSKVLAFRAAIMRERSYSPPAFRARLMEKDIRLAVDAAADLELALPMLERAAARFHEAVTAGYGDLDAAIMLDVQMGITPASVP